MAKLRKALTLSAALTCASIGTAQAGWLSNLFDNKEAETKHPMMLVPGIFAFDSISIVDYWHQIPAHLEGEGGEVYVAAINAFDSSVGRGEDLIEQLENIKAASSGRIQKFNLLGHSQGGMTSRYVMETRPDLVASVTTIHTPNKGTPVADLVNNTFPPATVGGTLFSAFANAVGDLVNLLSDNTKENADIFAMLSEFTQSGSAQFNATYPHGVPATACGEGDASVNIDGHTIRLYSWSGDRTATTVSFDISDPLFGITSLAFLGSGERNDGITGKCSSHFGKVIKDSYDLNHLDANNHVFGLTNIFETDPKTIFKNHAKRLKNAGL